MEYKKLHKDFAYQFMRGWNGSLEKVAEMIKDYRFSHDRFENQAIKNDIVRELRGLIKSDYSLDDVGVEHINDAISENSEVEDGR